MEGYLLKQGHVVKNWRRRYFRIRERDLVYYDSHRHDAKQCGRINLVGATVELGDALGSLGEGIASAADERRFVFRVTDGASHVPYYMCAEAANGPEASRSNLTAWVQCVQDAIRAAADDGPPTTDSISAVRESNQVTFSAAVSNAKISASDEIYELNCAATVVVPCAQGLEECTCKWTLWRTRAEFAALDGHLRYIFSTEMVAVAFPTVHAAVSFTRLLGASSLPACARAFDLYLQKILALDSVSRFELDGSRLVMEFLEYASHAAQLPQPPEVDDVRSRIAKIGRKILADAIAS
ncbi:hypothetical protein ACHHYP_11971 [Achlya hypogyna]|uniref:PH domain-containing protein n=1 Tax=Achlya hypogyna TaxID=1202772 RepID=A0A1V9YHU5_ACHHY|nr:hypothetical protein ACHHYP_11971 [Achlya hypogyna]